MKITLFLLIFPVFIPAATAQTFDRKGYYAVLRSGGVAEIDRELGLLESLGSGESQAYGGALLMRKAGAVKKPKEKMNFFRKGETGLETAIHDNPERTEYRFMRLIIQEHAPAIVHYRSSLGADRDMIRQRFAQLSPDLQEVIRDYSKESTVLHPADFK